MNTISKLPGISFFADDCMYGLRGQKFTTKDQDNDSKPDKNCARIRGGGWWHQQCGVSSLNGQYFTYEDRNNADMGGICWNLTTDNNYSFMFSEMKIRRA